MQVEKKVQEKQSTGKLDDLTLPELKAALKSRKLKVGGKKAQLVERLQQATKA